MNSRNSLLYAGFACMYWVLVCVTPAHAYLDLTTGSLLTQLIFGVALAGMASLKIWWSKITVLFQKKKEDRE